MLPVSAGLSEAGDGSCWKQQHLTDILKLGDDHRRDAGDSIFLAYQSGSYSKVCNVDTSDK
jgi:hypothetical protein